ncbi:hypothetical protein B0H15DRAFT_145630 [Mycena belliarum]|uniref:Galactose oxidase-like Early set domain-containing protein n=1 Tax=Mycena belliarum TaxID=1033014 RepID=A0AAD6UAC2_9AGAR|nr:hypothetical protein B0H15DRAFT_145630 [Mycena belliae]
MHEGTRQRTLACGLHLHIMSELFPDRGVVRRDMQVARLCICRAHGVRKRVLLWKRLHFDHGHSERERLPFDAMRRQIFPNVRRWLSTFQRAVTAEPGSCPTGALVKNLPVHNRASDRPCALRLVKSIKFCPAAGSNPNTRQPSPTPRNIGMCSRPYSFEKMTIFPSVEYMYPPYMQKTRPTFTGLPAMVAYNAAFSLTITVSAAARNVYAILMDFGFVTHSVHMDQKLVKLVSVRQGTNKLLVTGPPSAPVYSPGPGWIMVMADGVPSVAQQVMIGSGANPPEDAAAMANLLASTRRADLILINSVMQKQDASNFFLYYWLTWLGLSKSLHLA